MTLETQTAYAPTTSNSTETSNEIEETLLETNDILSKTIAVSIQFGSIGQSRKVSMTGVDIDADKNRLSLSAKILQCKEADAIRSLFGEVRLSLVDTRQGLLLPSLFKRGVYLVPIASVEAVDGILKQGREDLAERVEALVAVYPERIEADRIALCSKFSSAHYPSVEELREMFSISWRYLSLGASSQLESISASVYADEVERVKIECASVGDEIKATLRGAALALVTSMHERLSGFTESGKPKIFRDSTVNKLVEFLNTFEVRNVMNDSELSSTLGQMRSLLSGVTPADLRSNEALRSAVGEQVGAIQESLTALVTTQTRRVNLPD
tara:strand:+ start:913 stop:1893 length:981 start_codon:yes stop_codon:yes gene_type:complete